MPSVSWNRLLAVCQAEPPVGAGELLFTRFVFDSRTAVEPGTLFFALRGEQQDGHRYVADLSGRPGVAAVVRRDYRAPQGLTVPLLRVDDPLQSAHRLAADVRACLTTTRLVAVTGSAGKTSAKEFIFQILNHRHQAFRSPGNWNNSLGLPFALLNMAGTESHGVFEMGMSNPGIGEIDVLTRILRPHIAVILNALPVHLEFLKTVAQVARAKCEILNGLEPDGLALYNIDCPELRDRLQHGAGCRLIPFSPTRKQGELHYIDKRVYGQGSELRCSCFGVEHRFFVPLTHPAQHVNILVAVGVALALGLDFAQIAEALSTLKAVEGRGVVKQFGALTVLDETYNSNPEAARYALDWLASFSGSKVAVLGDMLELGEGSDGFHRQLGSYAASLGLKALIAVGDQAASTAEAAVQAGMPANAVFHYATALECRDKLNMVVQAGDIVLFKASHGVGLDRAIPR